MVLLGRAGYVRRQKRVTADSFFESSHLSLMQLVDCVYLWSQQMKQADACVETRMSRTSMIEWQQHNGVTMSVCLSVCRYAPQNSRMAEDIDMNPFVLASWGT